GRADPRLPRVEGRHGEPETHADRRADPGPALLRRKRPVGLRQHPSRGEPIPGTDRSPLTAEVPGERAGGEHARVRSGLLLQAGGSDDQAPREGLQGLVKIMRPLVLATLLGATLGVQASDGPLPTLPYTPGLDPAAMDRSVDPCVDFYAFSCAGWMV